MDQREDLMRLVAYSQHERACKSDRRLFLIQKKVFSEARQSLGMFKEPILVRLPFWADLEPILGSLNIHVHRSNQSEGLLSTDFAKVHFVITYHR
jgi:hypothetical protein